MPLAAGKHRGRDLVDLCGCHDEYDMGRRLFQCFQQGVECRLGEHVDFINDIDFVTPLVGGEIDLVAKIADIIHTGIGSSVDLDQVQEHTVID